MKFHQFAQIPYLLLTIECLRTYLNSQCEAFVTVSKAKILTTCLHHFWKQDPSIFQINNILETFTLLIKNQVKDSHKTMTNRIRHIYWWNKHSNPTYLVHIVKGLYHFQRSIRYHFRHLNTNSNQDSKSKMTCFC